MGRNQGPNCACGGMGRTAEGRLRFGRSSEAARSRIARNWIRYPQGRPPAGISAVTKTIEAIYRYPFYAHAPVETMNCVADVRGDRCTIWAPTQAPERLQKQVAELLGTTPPKVEVNITLIGEIG